MRFSSKTPRPDRHAAKTPPGRSPAWCYETCSSACGMHSPGCTPKQRRLAPGWLSNLGPSWLKEATLLFELRETCPLAPAAIAPVY